VIHAGSLPSRIDIVKTAEEWLRERSAAMNERYTGDCQADAKSIRALLIAEGREAWIGRLRKTEKHGPATFHGPLTPLRFRGRGGPTWTTHYVCCSESHAFDPLLGVPVPLEGYSLAVFGEEIAIERLPAG
jgi:hypothetical protein